MSTVSAEAVIYIVFNLYLLASAYLWPEFLILSLMKISCFEISSAENMSAENGRQHYHLQLG